ncbi:hypothetical protein NQ317_018216 [Molorchus minor]|uniref:J domain-containing protein n=1 Tax=Molorchus minor TaxID=1323400 RepID=A0ABQ9K598_9CUCU|nr:hypothetical protein NQ317_018216 [Molorchus minor]
MAQNLTKNSSRLVQGIWNINRYFFDNCRRNKSPNLKPAYVTSKRCSTNICWKCGAHREDAPQVFCDKCNVIQRPHQQENYFKVFDLDENFDVDRQILRNRFRKLQSLLHPDKFSNRSSEEQQISADYSSLLNKAYSNLNVPLKRAEHLLKLRGGSVGESQTVDDPEFLIEIMSLNEEMEEASTNIEKLKDLNKKNRAQSESISKAIDENFKNNDISKAKENVIKLKYFNSLSNRINGRLRELGDTD